MTAIWIALGIGTLILLGLIFWMISQSGQTREKGAALENQMNEVRRDLLNLATSQSQASSKMETIAESVAGRLESVTKALQEGVKNSAQLTSQITSQSQAAMSTELKNTREQISQIQKQLGEVQQAGQEMFQAARTLEGILGGAKSRGSLGEVTLERLLEDSLPRGMYETQYRFKSNERADAVIFLRDGKLMAIDSKFPLDAYRRIAAEGDVARREFVTAVKTHAEAIAKKYIVPDEGTLEIALMFVPSETVFYELLMSSDSKGVALDAFCREKRITPVSPNTLHANLTVIAMGLRGMQIEENAKRLYSNLAGLNKQVETFTDVFEKLGTHLKNAQQSYADADKRLEKATTTLGNLVAPGGETPEALDEGQGTLGLPPAANKKSA